MRKNWIRYLAVFVIATVPVIAGEYKKCTSSTQDCLNHMATKMKNSGYMGIEYDFDEQTKTLTIKRVIPESPAEKAGLKEGDVLYAMNGIGFGSDNEEALQAAFKPGNKVKYSVKRGGYDKEVTVELAPMPADVLAKYIGQHMLEHATVEVAENK